MISDVFGKRHVRQASAFEHDNIFTVEVEYIHLTFGTLVAVELLLV